MYKPISGNIRYEKLYTQIVDITQNAGDVLQALHTGVQPQVNDGLRYTGLPMLVDGNPIGYCIIPAGTPPHYEITIGEFISRRNGDGLDLADRVEIAIAKIVKAKEDSK